MTTDAMLQAAAFWAHVRQAGRPTAPAPALGGDVILARSSAELVVIATTNAGHLARSTHSMLCHSIRKSRGGADSQQAYRYSTACVLAACDKIAVCAGNPPGMG